MKFLFTLYATLSVLVLVIAKKLIDGLGDIPYLGRIPGSHVSKYYSSEYVVVRFPISVNSESLPDVYESIDVSGAQQIAIYTLPKSVTVSSEEAFNLIYKVLLEKDIRVLFKCHTWESGCGYYLPQRILLERRVTAASRAYCYGLKNIQNYDQSTAEFSILVGEIVGEKGKDYLLTVVGKSKSNQLVQYSYEVIKSDDIAAGSVL